jgi:hypothetical protein
MNTNLKKHLYGKDGCKNVSLWRNHEEEWDYQLKPGVDVRKTQSGGSVQSG